MGKLIALKDTAPGDVVYMRPDHGVFNPGHFAVIVARVRTAVRVVYLDATQTAKAYFIGDGSDRCVERVGNELAAKCEGMDRREVRRVCAALRAGDTDRDPGADGAGDDFMRRVLNAYHSEERAEAYDDKTQRAITSMRKAEALMNPPRIACPDPVCCPPAVDDGAGDALMAPTISDAGIEATGFEAVHPAPWANKAGPFGDP